MSHIRTKLTPDRMVGLAFAVALHAALLYGLWSYRMLPTPDEAATLFVNLISPPKPEPKVEERPKPPPPREVKLEKPRPVEKPQPQQLVVEAPVTAPSEPVAPPPPPQLEPQPPIEAPAPPAPAKPTGPVTLSNELSVSCPERGAPSYPAAAKRMGEQGRVVLRVELDESGRVSTASVATSSGSMRLDEASLAAVRQWHCNPARRDGEPVRAVALQPFDFILEGR